MTAAAGFKDHFSGHAPAYAEARPHYPPALFAWLAGQCAQRRLALDIGCGNGQAALALAEHFERVVASDASASQVAAAVAHPRVSYQVGPAERIEQPDHAADLLLVAQALHWFDFPAFFAEARRVLKPGAVFAALSYGLLRIAPELDALVDRFEFGVIGPYWPPERRHVDAGLSTIPIPFERIPAPPFELQQHWTLRQLRAYLDTWSAVQRYRRAHAGHDPATTIAAELAAAWGDPEQARTVRWPLVVWVGRVGTAGG